MESQVTEKNSQAHDVKKPVARPTPHSSAVGFTRAYAHDWEACHAFRELYQNWKDAIVESNDLDLLEFNPQVSDTEREILVAVHKHSETTGGVRGRTLGYIRLNKAAGVVEFANFGSMITSRSLELGHTTKSADARLAGKYGDGLKIAALVLCHHGYHVRIASDSCYWNFGFKGRSKNEFCYQVYPVGPDRIRKLKAANDAACQKGKPRKMAANIWEDCSVSVGSIRDPGKPVTADVFRQWMNITVDLNPPTVLVRTASGNLILDQEFAGHLYIKGIRVHLTDTKRTYRFGYDFLSGILNPNRDRRLEASPDEEARAVASIWEEAIRRQEGLVLPRYKELLRWHPSCADVALADTLLTGTTARKLWDVLAKDAQLAGRFYYPEGYADDNVHLIHHELKCEPDALSDPLWCLLRRFGLVRLPFEEVYRRFRSAKIVEPPETLFAQVIHRALAALLSAHPASRPTEIKFVQCGDSRPNVAYSRERVLFINAKWLDFWGAHSAAPCEVSGVWSEDEEFFCGHLITDLYKRAILAIMQPSWEQRQLSLKDAHTLQVLVRQCEDRVREMPTMVQLSRGASAGSLSVSWNDGYSWALSRKYGSTMRYFVILHGIACSAERPILWYSKDHISCDCPRQVVTQADNRAVFEGLDSQPRFPMVARFRDHAIYGLPPDPVSPDIGPHASTTAVDLPLAPSSEPEESDPYSPVLSFHSQYGASPLTTQRDGTDDSFSEPNENLAGLETPSPSSSLDNDEEPVAEMCALYDTYSQLSRAWKGQVSQEVRTLLNMLQAERRDTVMVPSFQGAMQHRELHKGQYIEAILDTEAGQHRSVFFIHEIWEPCESHPARLLMTRYSFLFNYPAFTNVEPQRLDENELVLHFTDADKMGEKGDGEIYAITDISLQRANFAVHHVPQKPALAGEYYCRVAIQNRVDPDSCFLTPVKHAQSNVMNDPACSLLPQASVIDMSPDDAGVSAGFSKAGFVIHRGLHSDQGHQTLWKMQNPTVETFRSIPDALEAWTQAINAGAYRVVTISRGMSWTQDTYEGNDSHVNPFHHCRFVAEHDKRPDFIFFNLPLAGWCAASSSQLVETILTLLERRYSVFTRLCEVQVSAVEEGRPVFFLLASPHYTNPSWIRNAFADVVSRIDLRESPLTGYDKSSSAIATMRGFSVEIGDSVQPHNYAEILDSLPPSFTCGIATVISTLCGRMSLQNRHKIQEGAMAASESPSRPKGSFKKPKLTIKI